MFLVLVLLIVLGAFLCGPLIVFIAWLAGAVGRATAVVDNAPRVSGLSQDKLDAIVADAIRSAEVQK